MSLPAWADGVFTEPYGAHPVRRSRRGEGWFYSVTWSRVEPPTTETYVVVLRSGERRCAVDRYRHGLRYIDVNPVDCGLRAAVALVTGELKEASERLIGRLPPGALPDPVTGCAYRIAWERVGEGRLVVEVPEEEREYSERLGLTREYIEALDEAAGRAMGYLFACGRDLDDLRWAFENDIRTLAWPLLEEIRRRRG